jgi:hypothetical protein
MEDVLAVYARPPQGDAPLVCLDEFAKQLLSDAHEPIPASPGHLPKEDYIIGFFWITRRPVTSSLSIKKPFTQSLVYFYIFTLTYRKLMNIEIEKPLNPS